MRSEQKRRAAAFLKSECHSTVARACRIVGLPRSTHDYKPKARPQDDVLRERLRELAARHRRWGLPRLHSTLRKRGFVKNKKRTCRIYAQEKLQVRLRRRKKLARVPRVARPLPSRPNEVWSIDFVFDWLLTKRKLKCLTIIDDFTREAVGIFAAHSISGAEVARFIDALPRKPARIRSDNGPEFASTAMLDWIEDSKIEHEFITPGKPNENAFIESFNSRFRDECLNEHVFRDLGDARRKIEDWRIEYNELHPHSSLGMKSAKEFAESYSQVLHADAAP